MIIDNATYNENLKFIETVMKPRRVAIDAAQLKADKETAKAMGLTVKKLRKKFEEANAENRNILKDVVVEMVEAGKLLKRLLNNLRCPSQ